MPKYTPGPDELYEIKPCTICGGDTLDNEETCSDFCQQQWDFFKKDMEAAFMEMEV